MITVDEYVEMLEYGNINQRAAAIAIKYGDIGGAHHKQWVIDQMLRLIAGDAYTTLIEYYEQDGENKWDTGIAP